jgi:hypothetical protein
MPSFEFNSWWQDLLEHRADELASEICKQRHPKGSRVSRSTSTACFHPRSFDLCFNYDVEVPHESDRIYIEVPLSLVLDSFLYGSRRGAGDENDPK